MCALGKMLLQSLCGLAVLAVASATTQFNIFNMSGLPNLLDTAQQARSVLSCNRHTQQQRITLQSPSQLLTNCTYRVLPFRRSVCELRIDFETFRLAQPVFSSQLQDLQCEDFMAVYAIKSAAQEPTELLRLCGENNGQHYYVPLHNGEELRVSFILPTQWSQSSWRLQLTQLECPTTTAARTARFLLPPFADKHATSTTLVTGSSFQQLLPPTGCQQYYTQRQGVIRTFNFNTQQRTLYLPNMRYAICIAGNHDTTYIKYRVNSFELSQANPTAPGFDSDCHALVETTARMEDYLMIPQANFNNAQVRPTYFCGQAVRANMEIIARAPFYLYFKSDDVTDANEIGFSISYQLCSNSMCV